MNFDINKIVMSNLDTPSEGYDAGYDAEYDSGYVMDSYFESITDSSLAFLEGFEGASKVRSVIDSDEDIEEMHKMDDQVLYEKYSDALKVEEKKEMKEKKDKNDNKTEISYFKDDKTSPPNGFKLAHEFDSLTSDVDTIIDPKQFESYSRDDKTKLYAKYFDKVDALKNELKSCQTITHSYSSERVILLSQLNTLQDLLQNSGNFTYKFYNTVCMSIFIFTQKIHSFRQKVENRTVQTPLKLRDPITKEIYNLLFLHAGAACVHHRELQVIKLKLVYTILYYTGLRVNEISSLTEADFLGIMETGKLSVFHSKTNTKLTRVIMNEGRDKICKLKNEIIEFFKTEKYLLSSNRKKNNPVNKELTGKYCERKVIEFVNKDIKTITKAFDYKGQYSTHSFRANFITVLLKTHPIHKVAQIIGHKSISSTMAYNRYELDAQTTERMLSEAFAEENT
jgi:integrase